MSQKLVYMEKYVELCEQFMDSTICVSDARIKLEELNKLHEGEIYIKMQLLGEQFVQNDGDEDWISSQNCW